MEGSNNLVNVAVRIRPLTNNDAESNLKVFHDHPSVLCVLDRQQTYSFDAIFDETADQNAVFLTTIRPMIDKLLLGYNCTVFAYGQTGTGKTYTMGNIVDDDTGMISRTFRRLFEETNKDLELQVDASLYEIYNEKVFDLLGDAKNALPVAHFNVQGLKRERVTDMSTAEDLMLIAGKNRHTAGTRQNANSSRSHAIYTLYISRKIGDSVTESKFNFVDLAGSESVRKTGNEGQQFLEGVSINKGLLYIGQVINALSAKKKHIPYRQSIITTLLQDSLSGENNVTLIACVSANPSDSTETVQTLEFAKNAKKVVSRPKINAAVNQHLKTVPQSSSVRKTRPLVTPSKRPLPFQTSTVRTKTRPLHSTLIEETSLSQPQSNFLVPRFSPLRPSDFNISGVSSIQEPPAGSFSPIVRRCVNAMEKTLITRIDMLIKENTKHFLRRSARLSTNLCKGCNETTGAQNPPLNQKTALGDITNRTGSMEGDARRLEGSSSRGAPERSPPVNNRGTSTKSTESTQGSDKDDSRAGAPPPILKVPHVQVQKNSSPDDRKPFVSGPQFGDSNVFFAEESLVVPKMPLRRSMRVRVKPERYSGSFMDLTVTTRKRRSNVKDSENVVPRKKTKAAGDNANVHENHVLRLLNTGTAKNLQSLHTIGQKTAEQIVLYRELRGKFSVLQDLKKVLYKGRTYDRFLQSNFLV